MVLKRKYAEICDQINKQKIQSKLKQKKLNSPFCARFNLFHLNLLRLAYF